VVKRRGQSARYGTKLAVVVGDAALRSRRRGPRLAVFRDKVAVHGGGRPGRRRPPTQAYRSTLGRLQLRGVHGGNSLAAPRVGAEAGRLRVGDVLRANGVVFKAAAASSPVLRTPTVVTAPGRRVDVDDVLPPVGAPPCPGSRRAPLLLPFSFPLLLLSSGGGFGEFPPGGGGCREEAAAAGL
jgi:hypothetical protein